MPTDQELFDELCFYTMSLRDPFFLHQNAVDAFAAQHVEEDTKPIKTVFALIGLYLTLEKGFTGRQVQLAHMRLAKHRKDWPKLPPTSESTSITVANALAAEPGPAREHAIREWCQSVWQTWQPHRETIVRLAQDELNVV
jgi:hypothetical protein